MIFSMPLPQMLKMTTVTMASSATAQWPVQLLMAELASVMPMQMIIGPVTTGGKKRMMRWVPKLLTRAASTR